METYVGEQQQNFQQEKFLMQQSLQRLEEMDRIAPLQKNQLMKHNQIEAKKVSFGFKQRIANLLQQREAASQNIISLPDQDTERLIQRSPLAQSIILKYFQPFVKRVLEECDIQPNRPLAREQVVTTKDMMDFNADDFVELHSAQQQQQRLAQLDIHRARQDEVINDLFTNEVKRKWNGVKRKLRMIGKVKRLYDDVKLFGTSCRVETSIRRKEVIEELEQIINKQSQVIESNFVKKQYQMQPFLFFPESRVKKYWAFVLMILLVYTAFVTPVRITFIDKVDLTWMIFDTVADGLFFLDILITFNSAFYTQTDVLVTDRRKIALHYITTWFFLDVLSVFPFDLVLSSNNNNYSQEIDDYDEEQQSFSNSQSYSGYFKLTRLPRLYNIVRLSRKVNVAKNVKSTNYSDVLQDLLQINSTILRVLKFFVTVIVCVHIMGCFWYYTAKIQDFGPNTWVYELNMDQEDDYELYLTSIYWAVATIFEMILSMFWMIFGVGFYSFTIGSLSTLLASLDTRSSHLQNKITFMDEFCEETRLPKQIRDKIRRVLEYNSQVNVFSHKDRDDFLMEIPTHLKYQIANAMYSGLETRLSFFQEKDQVFISTFIPKLQPLKVNGGEFIYFKGEYPNQVYFIVNGRVNMVLGVHAITFKTYVSGSYFGEIEIFDNSARLHSARAEVECELLSVQQDIFKHILQSFPEYQEEVKQTSIEKLKREREAIERLQIITGLSRNSSFFRKKRMESIYIAVKKRKPIELIGIQEENSSDEENSTNRRRRHQRKRSQTQILLDKPSQAAARNKSITFNLVLPDEAGNSQQMQQTEESSSRSQKQQQDVRTPEASNVLLIPKQKEPQQNHQYATDQNSPTNKARNSNEEVQIKIQRKLDQQQLQMNEIKSQLKEIIQELRLKQEQQKKAKYGNKSIEFKMERPKAFMKTRVEEPSVQFDRFSDSDAESILSNI